MYISVGVRFEANVEALNAVETTGNYAKHRKVPYIVEDENGRYKVIYVPAISGESLAHAYQEHVVREARHLYKSPPICGDCANGEFFKSMNKNHLVGKIDKVEGMSPEDIEKNIIVNCLVEDLGGFLYTEKPPVKRTSSFQFSYAVPVKSLALLSITEPQLHARHARMKEVKKRGERKEASEQMIYYIETGTAIYGFTFNLDLEAIGLSSYTGEAVVVPEERKRRMEVALKAFGRMISSKQFGARLSRFFPVGDIVNIYIAVTENPFSVTSPIYDDPVKSTADRLKHIKQGFEESVALYVYNMVLDEKVSKAREYEFVKYLSTPEEAIRYVIEEGNK